ncbi:hypothetical protein AN641_09770 [Candidatus Epulonipiscioides gigas]|nr:hypothetical protein AN641_09770 [Epulopiscium sp. SCG-C07WGA-EpuloA2]
MIEKSEVQKPAPKKTSFFKKFLLGIGGIIVFVVGIYCYLRVRPATTTIDPISYFSEFSSEYINMTFEDIRVDLYEPAILIDDNIFISSDFAEKYVDDTIFYDSNENILTITTLNSVKRFDVGETTKDFLFEKNGVCYILDTFLEDRFPIIFEQGADNRLIIARNLAEEKLLGKITKRTGAVIRTHADKKRDIIDDMPYGSIVEIYGTVLDYYRVRNENGMIGYIPKKYVEEIGASVVVPKIIYTPYELKKPLNEKVRLVWDQMAVEPVHEFTNSRYDNLDDINVISPTWFEFANDDGDLISRASARYMQQARSRGLLIWPLLSNNFSEPQFTQEILTSTTKRQHVIDQLIEYAKEYNFDGINIDIENVTQNISREWVQFMRELYPQLGELGLCVSVDVYIPSDWSKFYMRDKISQVVDYFIVMAYDEHWSGSPKPGPVASLGWVEEGLILNLEEVPNYKLVLGIPFFNRIWAQTSDGTLETRAISMYEANNRINAADVNLIYDDLTGLNYAEFVQNNKTYKMWLEDKEAINKRVKLIEEYDLAGYAAWKLGLETGDIWEELSKMSN